MNTSCMHRCLPILWVAGRLNSGEFHDLGRVVELVGGCSEKIGV